MGSVQQLFNWERIYRATAVFFAVLLCLLVYTPGLSGAFIFDDWQNIVENDLIQIAELTLTTIKQVANSTNAGPLGRPLSMISFALNYWSTGSDPYWFKLTNILIHTSVGLSLFVFGHVLFSISAQIGTISATRRQIFWAALLPATIWMLHPLNLTVVLYVVQRMTSLATLFSVLSLTSYCIGRKQNIDGKAGFMWFFLAFLIFLPLAALSKESGLLVPAYCAVLEIALFHFRAASIRAKTIIKFAYAGCVVAALYVLSAKYHWFTGYYGNRDFTQAERLLTESRAIWLYLKLIIVPNLGDMTIYHDDFAISKDLLSPPTTLIAIFCLFALLIVAVLNLKRRPFISFAILFFFAGHLMESTIIPLELVFEHRNYLAMYGFCLMAGHLLFIQQHDKLPTVWKQSIAIVLVALAGLLTLQRASIWGQPFELVKHNLQHHPNSPRTSRWVGDVYLQIAELDKSDDQTVYFNHARDFFRKAAWLQPSMCSALLDVIILDVRLEKKPQHETLNDLLQCLRTPPMQAATINSLADLPIKLDRGDAELPDEAVRSIFAAGMSNPNSQTGRLFALMSGGLGYYLHRARNDLNGAIDAYENSVQADPKDAGLWVAYAQTLIADGQYQNAKHAVTQAKDVDRGNMKPTIDALTSMLAPY